MTVAAATVQDKQSKYAMTFILDDRDPIYDGFGNVYEVVGEEDGKLILRKISEPQTDPDDVPDDI